MIMGDMYPSEYKGFKVDYATEVTSNFYGHVMKSKDLEKTGWMPDCGLIMRSASDPPRVAVRPFRRDTWETEPKYRDIVLSMAHEELVKDGE